MKRDPTGSIRIESVESRTCGISGDSEFVLLWDLPQLPLTEAFGEFDPGFPTYDQQLVMSATSGHVQLHRRLDPGVLYTASNYAFRSAGVAKTQREMALLEEFILKGVGGRPVDHLLEVGGNDLTLGRKLRHLSNSYTVCDPVLASRDGTTEAGISILGQQIEEAIPTARFESPDVVISRHTVEHLDDPRTTLSALVDASSDECLFVVEVPSLADLAESLRFDAIFHQHYHYFDVHSARRLAWECGGCDFDHVYNHEGSNGGSLLFSFRKGHPGAMPAPPDVAEREAWLRKRIVLFEQQLHVAGELLRALPRPIFGYGAGHMLATLGYHLGTDFSELESVLDDDPSKQGLTYRNVKVAVKTTGAGIPPLSSYLITSMENLRPIHRRIQDLKPRRILAPLIT